MKRPQLTTITALHILAWAALLSACSLMPKPAPELDLPQLTATTPVELDRWWESFRDPVLDGLIAEALARGVRAYADARNLAGAGRSGNG